MTRASPFIKHHIASCPLPADNSTLYDYILAGNGSLFAANVENCRCFFQLSNIQLPAFLPLQAASRSQFREFHNGSSKR